MKLTPQSIPTNLSPASAEGQLAAPQKLLRRRTVRPAIRPQFKERMVLPMLVQKPVVPGADRGSTNESKS